MLNFINHIFRRTQHTQGFFTFYNIQHDRYNYHQSNNINENYIFTEKKYNRAEYSDEIDKILTPTVTFCLFYVYTFVRNVLFLNNVVYATNGFLEKLLTTNSF
jgi:hypothetical protein